MPGRGAAAEVRGCSLAASGPDVVEPDHSRMTGVGEWRLALALLGTAGALRQALVPDRREDGDAVLHAHVVPAQLARLASAFSSFYSAERVLAPRGCAGRRAARAAARLGLVAAVHAVGTELLRTMGLAACAAA